MQKKTTKILLFVLLTSSLFSSENKPFCYPSGYNSAYKNYKTSDIFIESSFLYWQTKEQGLDVGLFNTTNKVNPSKVLNTHFKYSPGFRICFGSNFSDGWDIFADYTLLKTENSMSKRSDLTKASILNYWSFSPVTSLNKIKSKWNLDLNIFNLSFGRSYFVGKKLIFNPFLGLISGKIDQKIKISSSSLITDFLFKDSSRSNLIGPRLGIKTRWILNSGFSFFSDFSASLFCQYFHMHLEDTNYNDFLYQAEKKEKSINSNIDILTSFDWSHSFDRLSLYVLAGYEMQFFNNQNHLRSFAQELKSTTNLQPGNLMPHGFVFSLKLTF